MTSDTTFQQEPSISINDDNFHYAGFWRRFGAYWLDVLILLPLTALSMWMNELYRLAPLYTFLPWIVFSLWYSVYLVKRYGGTPGKLLLKMRIVRCDGSAVGYREASIRFSVLMVLSTLASIGLMMPLFNISDIEFQSLGFTERSHWLLANAPAWFEPVQMMMNIWIWSEFVIMMTNKRRRAPHDFMAGTVVIRVDPTPSKL